MQNHRVIILMVVLIMVTAGTAAGDVIKKDFHETFMVARGHRLHLLHGDGDVNITPWEKDEIDIIVKYRADVDQIGMGSNPDFTVEFSQDGSTVSVIGQEKSTVTVGYVKRKKFEYTYTIQAPAYLLLDLDGDDGDVDIRNWRADLRCDLDDGDVTLENILNKRTVLELQDGDLQVNGLRGELEVSCDDGDVHLVRCTDCRCDLDLADGEVLIEDFSGEIRIRADDGDVEIMKSQATRLDIRGEDGDIRLGILPVEDLDLVAVTEDGDIRCVLNLGVGAEFRLEADGGDIQLDIDKATIDRQEDELITGTVGDGTGSIHLRTSDGRVTLGQR